MPREKETYRDNLEYLIARTNGQAMLNIKEVSELCGIDKRTAKKLFPFNECNMISLPSLARKMSV